MDPKVGQLGGRNKVKESMVIIVGRVIHYARKMLSYHLNGASSPPSD